MSHPLVACTTCGSTKVYWGIEYPMYPADAVVCGDCGKVEAASDLEWECPHCGVNLGEPFSTCTVCGLDAQHEYSSPDLAFLWRTGSGIQEMMKRDRPITGPSTYLGGFLREQCGPHCNKDLLCEQRISDLVKCSAEHRREKAKKKLILFPSRGVLRYTPPKPILHTTFVQFAEGGWFSTYFNETYRIQQANNTRDGT